MARYSFIDKDKKDFLRYKNGDVIVLDFNNYDDAEEWLILNGSDYDWEGSAIFFFNWEDTFKK